MDFTARVLLTVLVFLSAILFQNYREISKNLPAPELDVNKYWGPGDGASYKEDYDIEPTDYKPVFPEKAISELKSRLSRSLMLHKPLEGTGFEYGFNSEKLQQVISYWRDNYLARWREREIYLWKFPHKAMVVQGLRIHFLHTKVDKNNAGKKVFPLLLLHGWPGSVREFYEIIPKLALPNDESDYVFEVVAPSLPGYGWSQAPSKPGFGPAEMGVVLRNLMLKLGYKKFFIQGGDWGSIVGSHIATLFPENVIGYHSNMCGANTPLAAIKIFIASYFPSLFVEEEHQHFFFPTSEKLGYIIEESGYMHLQASKPDTIGHALTDNPVGLVAYILEKFSTWTNRDYRKLPDGGLGKDIPLDALLDNIMIYYLTNSITTSFRLYSEAFAYSQQQLNLDRVATDVPTGCARFKYDLLHSMDSVLKEKYTNLMQSTYYDNGGHFAAMQVPEVLYKDFIQFVKKVVNTK